MARRMYAASLMVTFASVVIVEVWGIGIAEAAMLRVGRAHGRPEGTVSVPVRFARQQGENIVGLSGDITFDATVLANPRCEVARKLGIEWGARKGRGGSEMAREKTAVCSEPRPGVVRIGIFGLNLVPIPAGEVATVTFDVLPTAKPGRYPLTVSPGSAGPAGEEVGITTGKDGFVRVRELLP